MGEFDAVCFDLDSTLCVSEQSDAEIHEAVFERCGVDPFFSPADVRAVDSAELPTAETDREFYEHLYREVCESVGGDPAHAPDLAAATLDVVDPAAVTFREGAREALAHARERYDVGLITNGGEDTQTAKLEQLGVADAFDATVFCDPADGIEPKPHPAPFERALAELDAAPERTLYVGDQHAADVVGAHEAGLRSAWVPPDRDHQEVVADPDPAPTHRLDSMAELSRVF
ncbi:HAD family hydrolase [Halosimplex aquaticum]|uniref:HAD family hydrolase n=1 Tax=Halosimplex aquaticum TaxID=3026162 RepID=A0ABD5XZN6_9EURY|nr:HAD family hydrolase [Halosimplex aquaticum]